MQDDARQLSTVKISGLFGRPTIEIRVGDEGSKRRFSFLYGENGAGKSTILRLIYSVFSHNSDEGNREFIAQTPFDALEIAFSDGLLAEVRKDGEGFAIVVRSSNNLDMIAIEFKVEEGRLVDSEKSEERYARMIRSFGVKVLYIKDDRSILTNIDSINKAFGLDSSSGSTITYKMNILAALGQPDRGARVTRKASIAVISDLLHEWLVSQTISSGRSGQFNVNRMYMQIAKDLAEIDKPDKYTHTKKKLNEELSRLRDLSAIIIKYGLSPNVDFYTLEDLVQKCPSTRIRALGQVITPYLRSLSAIYEKLSPVATVIDTLVSEISEYYTNIQLSYNVESGFEINAHGAIVTHQSMIPSKPKTIKVTALSSGQRQLFFMFASLVLTRSDSAILLIDEPEISLNIKWQRRLIPSFARILRGSNSQVVCATHSFEILSRYRSSLTAI